MLDLIKMDLYRMFRMKSMFVTALIYTLYAYLFTWAELAFYDKGFSVSMGVALLIDSMLPLLFISIFCVLFITFDTHSGFIKSYMGQLPSRVYRLASKLICCCIYQLIAFIYVVVCEAVMCVLISGALSLGSVESMIKLLAAEFVMHFAIVCVILLLTTLFKAQIAPIIFSVCIALGIFQGVTNLIYLLFDIVFEIDFDPSKYLITPRIDDVAMGLLSDRSQFSIGSSLALSLVYIVIALILSVAVFRKKDLS